MKYNIGVEIGATLIQVVIVDKYGRLVARSKIPAHVDRPPAREKLNAGVFSKELAVPMLKLSEMGSASFW